MINAFSLGFHLGKRAAIAGGGALSPAHEQSTSMPMPNSAENDNSTPGTSGAQGGLTLPVGGQQQPMQNAAGQGPAQGPGTANNPYNKLVQTQATNKVKHKQISLKDNKAESDYRYAKEDEKLKQEIAEAKSKAMAPITGQQGGIPGQDGFQGQMNAAVPTMAPGYGQ